VGGGAVQESPVVSGDHDAAGKAEQGVLIRSAYPFRPVHQPDAVMALRDRFDEQWG